MNTNTEAEQPNERKIDYLEIISLLWAKKKFIMLVTLITTVVFVGLTFLMTPTFLSSTVILPDMGKDKLGPLGDLASLAGINIGGEVIMVKLYPDIIQSEAVLTPVIRKKYKSKFYDQPVNLIEYFEIEEETTRRTQEVVLERMRKLLKIEMSQKTGLLTYSIETKDAQVSADILNTITAELNNFLLTKKATNAGEQRKWIEQRLKEVKLDLSSAENVLKEFREKNRRVTDSPQLLLEQERLMRNVIVQSTIYSTLIQQYEMAKIEELKYVPIINVLDEAKPAAEKNSPKRRLFVTIGFLLSFFGAVGYVIVKNKFSSEVEKYLKIFKPVKNQSGE
ncbi:MAG: Wzz/FepE/Etk N-terminal domain-containing protein [Bacteroidota bacterium]|nr:Wzz/FepE/Etk N-terminal domain-containing protein [Bacteroidota bacterium]